MLTQSKESFSSDVVHSDIASKELVLRSNIVNNYSLLAFVSLIVFGAMHIVAERTPLIGTLELAGAALIACNALVLRMTHNIVMARAGFLLTVAALLIALLLTGGTENTGIFWYFVFPVSAFFLTDKKQGIWWIAALLTTTVGVVILAHFSFLSLPYSLIEVRQLIITVAVVAVGIYVYQMSREALVEQIHKSDLALQEERTKVDHAKDEFIALASHQLRTPISSIAWVAEILLSGDVGALPQTQREYIQQIYDSNQRSASTVDAILTISNLELGSFNATPEPIDLLELTHKLLSDESRLLDPKKRLRITEHYDHTLPKVQLDQQLTKTLLKNVFSNAFKYTVNGGEVTVSVMLSTKKVSPASHGSIVIKVADTGYGIPAKQQARVFEKLFRASNIKIKDTDGIGLGLYLAKKILDRMGGRISLISEEGKGSTFTILLPLEGMPVLGASKNV